jgi:NAD(P)-dependent dehydrogenase (short-subunit alcohol dehydrogenase family)
VTGGGGGLGRAVCEQLGQARARVVVADINAAGAEETARLVRSAGGQARVEIVDVRDPSQVERLERASDAWFGGTDLLINNAGVGVTGPVGEVSLEDWKWQVEINLYGVIYGCHYWVPRMKARGYGHVLNVASAAGLIAAPGMAPYNTTKAAVIALSETLHAEVKSAGIRVSALCPSFFRTGIGDSGRGVVDDQSRQVLSKLMDNRVQAPEVAKVALRAVEKGQMYCLPMPEVYLPWLFKRALPNNFYDFMALTADRSRLAKLLGIK